MSDQPKFDPLYKKCDECGNYFKFDIGYCSNCKTESLKSENFKKNLKSFIWVLFFGLLIYATVTCETNQIQSVTNYDSDLKPKFGSNYRYIYTSNQLQKLIYSGNLPKVIEAQQETLNKKLNFEACKNHVYEMLNRYSDYPRQKIVNNSILLVYKLWTDEFEALYTCSQPDKKFTLVTTPYSNFE